MADRSRIEWTDATWNPIRGCTKVSAGCDNCYAMRQAHRMDHPGGAYEGLTRTLGGRPQWNGRVRVVPDVLELPLRWTRPRRIFVNSMSDLFHPNVPEEFIDQVFAVMALSPNQIFQVLTKRPERMWDYVAFDDGEIERRDLVAAAAFGIKASMPGRFSDYECLIQPEQWPLKNVWLGVSVEDQATADERIPLLLDTPAAIRWVSCEPLLGAVDLSSYLMCPYCHGHSIGDECSCHAQCAEEGFSLDWVVAGGESGPGARPAHPDWFRSLRGQCQAAGVPFCFKQWGNWFPGEIENNADGLGNVAVLDFRHDPNVDDLDFGYKRFMRMDDGQGMWNLGKKMAGRHLDGRTWDEYPDPQA